MDSFVSTLLTSCKNLTKLNLKFYKYFFFFLLQKYIVSFRNFIGKTGQNMIINSLKMVKIKRYMLNIAYNLSKKIKGGNKKKIISDLLVLYDFSRFDSEDVMQEYFGDYAEASAYIEEYKEEY